ncbi:DUF4350 domain-containing protein [Cellulomonas shaoxiangyii]|uniref:DUF4350 domain-containing protein n=1 Tax=Cellulomonas shaoxiangyii TaxID=2566013 RepID=A0A4P7SGP5_9CELL|nr:DUF4350 domain-containing protein [Cellulomonas shaoxiangyii]QCB93162.1 DUF4350 domain-containing protein [Cellulomonas shaoxiangyii]TGY79649.1 DUF4350 domain-containing protein [Cellulomonas shaoxiangyii]
MSAPTTGPTTVPLRPGEVLGDGTTGRTRAAGTWRRARPWLAVAAVLLVGVLVLLLPAPPSSTTPGAPDNAGGAGTRALAQVLERRGVEVEYVRTTAEAEAAAARGGTVLVVGDVWLLAEQVDRIAALENDLVLVDAGWALSLVAPELTAGGDVSPRGVRQAACDDPDARAAGAVVAGGSVEDLAGEATVCFPPAAGAAEGAYVVLEQEGRRVTALSDLTPLTNDAIAQEGNAALALRTLGRHDHLVWYLPSLDDVGTGGTDDAGASLTDLVPWVRPVALWLLLVLAVVVVWRARRLGPVVSEPLPVVVRSAEATRGRGRLYRRGRAHGHAAAALRAGTATRSAQRLGLARSTPAPALVDAVARASGRPSRDVEQLLYGPPPTDDAGLQRLADDLHHLESEVHRP